MAVGFILPKGRVRDGYKKIRITPEQRSDSFAQMARIGEVGFDEIPVNQVEKTAGPPRYCAVSMIRRGGQDSGCLSRAVPTAMTFVPSLGGRSHPEWKNTDGLMVNPVRTFFANGFANQR
jgi:hypothetical protein